MSLAPYPSLILHWDSTYSRCIYMLSIRFALIFNTFLWIRRMHSLEAIPSVPFVLLSLMFLYCKISRDHRYVYTFDLFYCLKFSWDSRRILCMLSLYSQLLLSHLTYFYFDSCAHSQPISILQISHLLTLVPSSERTHWGFNSSLWITVWYMLYCASYDGHPVHPHCIWNHFINFSKDFETPKFSLSCRFSLLISRYLIPQGHYMILSNYSKSGCATTVSFLIIVGCPFCILFIVGFFQNKSLHVF